MTPSERIKLLRDYAKQVESGNTDTTEFMDPSDKKGFMTQSRNLSEDALAEQVSRNTNIPVPDKRASKNKIVDFLNQHAEQRYPEVKGEIVLGDELLDSSGRKAEALFHPRTGKIELAEDIAKKDPIKALSGIFHEKAHGFDQVNKLPSIDKMDYEALDAALKINPDLTPDQKYEILAGKHHGKIKGLREGTFGLGALKSYLKSGNFKSILPGAVSLGAGAALAGSASDALADTIVPGGVESAGEGSDVTGLSPEQQQSVDASRELTGGAPLNQARLRALQKMLGR